MSLEIQITEAIINEDRDTLSNIYLTLIKEDKIKPFKLNINKLLLLIKYNLFSNFKLLSCIDYNLDNKLESKLVLGAYLFVDII